MSLANEFVFSSVSFHVGMKWCKRKAKYTEKSSLMPPCFIGIWLVSLEEDGLEIEEGNGFECIF